MNQREFIEARDRLRREEAGNRIYTDGLLNRTLTFFSANLSNFLPEIPVAEHEALFSQLMLSRDLSVLEQQYAGILDQVSCEGIGRELFATLDRGPVIFCTFHMGANRVINHFLAANKIPYSLVVANHISRQEGELFVRMFDEVYKAGTGDELPIIRAQEPNAVLRMRGELKRGRSLLLYIDGNTGAGDDSINNGNRSKIGFLHQSIYARTGIGYLSHTFRIPIVPVVCYRKTIEDLRLKFFPPLYPDAEMDKHLFAREITQRIYDLFVPILRNYPEQWECWIYLHTVANTKEFVQGAEPGAARFQLNKRRFGSYTIGEEMFLFDKQTYNSYPIDKITYQALLKATQGVIGRHELDQGLFQQLYDNHVFINI